MGAVSDATPVIGRGEGELIALAGRLGGRSASEVRERLHAAGARGRWCWMWRGWSWWTPPGWECSSARSGLERILPTENHDPDPLGPEPVAA